MKSGVAVQLRLAAGLAAPLRDVTYVFYDCEEVAVERNGLLRLARTSPTVLAGDFAVLLEPSGGVVEGGCQGTLRAAVRATGARAHTARSWMGRNAIHEAGAILDVLRALGAARHRWWTACVPRRAERRGHLRRHRRERGPGLLRGPGQLPVRPDLSADEAVAHLRSLFAGCEVEVLDVAPGARPGLEAPAAAAFVAAVGGTPRPKLGWTDVARFAELGIPAVNYGPGIPEIAHTAGEYVELAAIADCETRLRAWLSA